MATVASLALTTCGDGQGDNTKASTKVSSRPLPAEPSDDAVSGGDTADRPGSKDGATGPDEARGGKERRDKWRAEQRQHGRFRLRIRLGAQGVR